MTSTKKFPNFGGKWVGPPFGNKLWRARNRYDNSLFETTDESCPLISGIPTISLIDPCENCTSFCHKMDEIGISPTFLSW